MRLALHLWVCVLAFAQTPALAATVEVVPGQAIEARLSKSGPLDSTADLLFIEFLSAQDPPDGDGFTVGGQFTATLYDGDLNLGSYTTVAETRYRTLFAFASPNSLYTVGEPTLVDFQSLLSLGSQLRVLITSPDPFDIRAVFASGNLVPDLARGTSPDTAVFTNSPNYLIPENLSVVTAVPEPQAALLMLVGLLILRGRTLTRAR